MGPRPTRAGRRPPARRFPAGALSIALLAAAGCSDSTSPDLNTLDEQASVEIMQVLMSEVLTLGVDELPSEVQGERLELPEGPTGTAGTALPETVQIDLSVPCPVGGTAAISGTFTNDVSEQGDGTATFSVTQTPSQCGVETSQGVFQVSGNPNLSYGGSITMAQGEPTEFSMEFQGGWSWTGPDGAGACTLDVSMSMNFATGTASISGHVCGNNVNQQVT